MTRRDAPSYRDEPNDYPMRRRLSSTPSHRRPRRNVPFPYEQAYEEPYDDWEEIRYDYRSREEPVHGEAWHEEAYSNRPRKAPGYRNTHGYSQPSGNRRPDMYRKERQAIYDDYEERLGESGNDRTNRRRPRPIPKTSRRQLNTAESKPHKSSGKIIFSFLYNLLFYTVTIGILLMSLMFAFSSKSSASIFGYRFYTVLTDSMAPQKEADKGGFYSGDIVVVRLMESDQLEAGDIVTFSVGDGERYLTHRLVERLDELAGETGDYIVTKGDANQTNDPPVEASRVIGKVVFSLPKLGSWLDFFRENWLLCSLCIVSTFGFILVIKAYLFGEAKNNGNGKEPSSKHEYRQRSYQS